MSKEKAIKELDKLLKKEQAATAKEDKAMKAKGYTHRAEIWIHPITGGDDYQIGVYYNYLPSVKEIAKQAKKKGSAVIDDFRITKLK